METGKHFMCLGQWKKKKSFQRDHIIEKDMIRKIHWPALGDIPLKSCVSALLQHSCKNANTKWQKCGCTGPADTSQSHLHIQPRQVSVWTDTPTADETVGKRVRSLHTSWGNRFESHTHNTFIKRSPTHKYQLDWSDWSLLILYPVRGCGQRSAVGPLARLLLPSGF